MNDSKVIGVLDLALDVHKAGETIDAIRLYRRILSKHPGNADASHLLGIALREIGQLDEAILWLEKSVDCNANEWVFKKSLATTYVMKGCYSQAKTLLEEIISYAPNDIDSLCNYAITLQGLEVDDKALVYYKSVLDQQHDNLAALENLGTLYEKLRRIPDAIETYKQALEYYPKQFSVYSRLVDCFLKVEPYTAAGRVIEMWQKNCPGDEQAQIKVLEFLEKMKQNEALEAYSVKLLDEYPNNATFAYACGFHLAKIGCFVSSEKYYRKAIKILGVYPEAENSLGELLMKLNRRDEAIVCFQQAIESSPSCIESYLHLSTAYCQDGSHEMARMVLESAMNFSPDNNQLSEIYNGYSNSFYESAEYETSIYYMHKALDLNPRNPIFWENLGVACKDGFYFDEAMAALQTARELKPNNYLASFIMSFIYLYRGELSKGWRCYDDAIKSGKRILRDFGLPVWQGHSLKGKGLLVFLEQGLGDQLIYSTCFQEVVDQASKVVIACDERLVPIMKRSFVNATIHGVNKDDYSSRWLEKYSELDMQVAMASLPRYLRDEIEKFPSSSSRLKADDEQVRYWVDKLKNLGPGLKLGVCWRGGLRNMKRDLSYTSLEEWLPILELEGVQFVNVMYDQCQDEILDVRRKYGVDIHDFTELDKFNDLDGLAALMCALDGVISVNTSIAAMAGALGRPLWFLSPACLYTTLGTGGLPWFPSAKVFEQDLSCDWRDAILNLTADLNKQIDS